MFNVLSYLFCFWARFLQICWPSFTTCFPTIFSRRKKATGFGEVWWVCSNVFTDSCRIKWIIMSFRGRVKSEDIPTGQAILQSTMQPLWCNLKTLQWTKPEWNVKKERLQGHSQAQQPSKWIFQIIGTLSKNHSDGIEDMAKQKS